MAISTSIPISEYLQTSYRPDCDYIDGKVKERTLGTWPHGFLQGYLAALFNRNWRAWQALAGTEIRVRVSATRIRIPDVCVLRRSDPADPVVLVAPLICIEVLSPDDTLRSQRDRVEDYFSMGVEHIWLIDPVTREAWTATPTGYDTLTTGEFTVPGTPIRISLPEVFAELDEMQSPSWLFKAIFLEPAVNALSGEDAILHPSIRRESLSTSWTLEQL